MRMPYEPDLRNKRLCELVQGAKPMFNPDAKKARKTAEPSKDRSGWIKAIDLFLDNLSK